MADITGQMGELRFTLEVKRKDTGKTETIEMVGFIDEAKLKEIQDGSNSLDGGTQRGN